MTNGLKLASQYVAMRCKQRTECHLLVAAMPRCAFALWRLGVLALNPFVPVVHPKLILAAAVFFARRGKVFAVGRFQRR